MKHETVVAYQPRLAAIVGVKAALLLSQLLYWTPRTKPKAEGWIFKSAVEWQEETGLTYKEQRKARARLVAKKVIEERYARLEHRLYFRVNLDTLSKGEFANVSKGISPSAQRADGESPKGQLANHPKGNSITYTPTENTSKTNNNNGVVVVENSPGIDGEETQSETQSETESETQSKSISTVPQSPTTGNTVFSQICRCGRPMEVRTNAEQVKFWGCTGFRTKKCKLTAPYTPPPPPLPPPAPPKPPLTPEEKLAKENQRIDDYLAGKDKQCPNNAIWCFGLKRTQERLVATGDKRTIQEIVATGYWGGSNGEMILRSRKFDGEGYWEKVMGEKESVSESLK